MLYESTYNQYFLEHSWGPWKKHMYISRDEKNGRFVYKYPKEYYEKYEKRRADKMYTDGNEWLKARQAGDTEKANALWKERQKIAQKDATRDSEYYNEYYNTDVDKVINRSVKSAVKALNFGMDMKEKAEGYLNRFAKAVSNAWNSTKGKVSSYTNTGKSFLQGVGYLTKTAAKVVTPRIAASVQNLIKGASEAISKGWNNVANKKSSTGNRQRVSKGDEELEEKLRRRGPWYGY